MNYVSLQDYKRAIQLALAMSQPGRLFSLFKEVSGHEQTALTGNASVDEVIKTLGGSDLAKLLRYVRDWNTNAKTAGVAQGVLFAVTKTRSAEEVIGAFGEEGAEKAFAEGGDGVVAVASSTGGTAVKELMDALIPYSERHLSRLERLVQESYVVDYILGEMDDGMDVNLS
jgi:U3 small nucleolar RNA-associated protein 13